MSPRYAFLATFGLAAYTQIAHAAVVDPAPADADAVAPEPGSEAVKPTEPTWCPRLATPRTTGPYRSDLDQNEGQVLAGRFKEAARRAHAIDDDLIERLAWLSCQRGGDANRQRWVAIMRQIMINLDGMTEAENRERLALATIPSDDRDAKIKEACKRNEVDARTPDELARAVGWNAALGCVDKDVLADQLAFLSKEIAFPTQLATAAFVNQCLTADPLATAETDLVKRAADYTVCARDVAALDRHVFRKELDHEKRSIVERVLAAQTFARAKRYSGLVVKALGAKAAKEPALKDVLFARPEAGWKQWLDTYKANKAAIDVARAYEWKFAEANGAVAAAKKSFAGCGTTLRAHLARYLKSQRPKEAADVRRALQDAVGYPLSVALAACDAIEERPTLAQAAKELVLDHAMGISGPRQAAYASALRAIAEAKQASASFPYAPEAFSPRFKFPTRASWAQLAFNQFLELEPYDGSWTMDDKPQGRGRSMDATVAGVKPAVGGFVRVSFKEERWREPVVFCKNTNQIDRIDWHSDDSAQVVYRQSCRPNGTQERVAQLPPILVPGELAKGIKPGQLARVFVPATTSGERPGFVVESYSDKERKRLATCYGVEL